MGLSRVLMVAEKPSVAEAIAKALSPGCSKQSRGSLPLWQLKGEYEGREAEIRVTSTTGHIFSLDFSSEYNDRNRIDETTLFDAPVKKKVESSGVVAMLQKEGREVDRLVLWLDCDREGENICYEVIGIVGKVNAAAAKSARRVKFSSLVASDLRQAFKTALRSPNKCESDSVDARQELDLKIGVSFTRFLTRYLKDFHGSTVSYGPCQMPTLWFCVNRLEEIESFVSQRFWTLELSIFDNSTRAQWQGGRVYDEQTARVLHELFREAGSTATVAKKATSTRKLKRPLPFNTMNMLKAASTTLGMSPQRAMMVAENLYLSGYITYPRTESTKFAPAFDVKQVVGLLTGRSSCVASLAQNLFNSNTVSPNNAGVDMGDHPPITPCAAAGSFMSDDHERLYTLIASQFLQSICSEDAVYTDHVLELVLLGDQVFKTKLTKLTKLGHLAYKVFGGTAASDTTGSSGVWDMLNVGDRIAVDKIALNSDLTRPPSLLSESDLLTLMEKNSIGTDASVTQHIQSIVSRGYVHLKMPGRFMEPTKLGLNLCRGFTRIDSELTRPTVRAIIERSCDQVAKGNMDRGRVVQHVLSEFKVKFQHFLRRVKVLDEVLNLSVEAHSGDGRAAPLSRCGRCRRYMVLLNQRKLICLHCAFALSVPLRCKLRTVAETAKCIHDDFEILVAIEKNNRAYCFCPFCYNYPPTAASASASAPGAVRYTCLDSASKTMYGSLYRHGLGLCDSSDCSGRGWIYLQNFNGCHLSLACTGCRFLLPFDHYKVKSVRKVLPQKLCPGQCGWYIVEAQLQPQHLGALNATRASSNTQEEGASLAAVEEMVVGCLGCNETLTNLLTGGVFKRHKRSTNFKRKKRH
ncbi:putative DNA topoisomerase III [Gregarina niphandrodes]|uniref:DNA topoisomerase n=1 Tax=Gregarina niphandrodes TaxID=110365 RepID=A0A023BA92_GRENI|nr:putative DNA topoisomerase III [Gregarina niphandrodes]EZG77688.1 putative DNA topoisomerase III [Gregarina niphandrodes]|eukprot:XP_011129487.1 putative DNA topoisomerase III [Gregarina niphandrodes]